ncbi:amidohydrolase family protein [Schaalia sp. ZJ405]|uniref:amidohydrolase family protein n=1 Tax=unclassified Schaalia TaxID=2691889 RepID=UPI0013ED4C8F|nr:MULTISPECIES: amidohydrolase family protein [unclassified Schaalia]QPK81422.1 amidohydrolase family protein [Schaalia sp. ZJ405]
MTPSDDRVTVWSAGMVIPITAPSMMDGAVAVRHGRIEHVGARDWVLQTLRDRGLTFQERHFDGVLMPGLVNAHTHLQYTGMSEVGSRQYSGFQQWVDAFDAVYDRGPMDWGRHAGEGAAQLIRFGTTSAADVVTDPQASSALHDAGLHGVAYWEVMGWSNEDWSERGPRTVETALDAMPSSPAIGLSPHAPYSLDTNPLLDLPDLARRRGLRLHIHLGESHSEAEWSESRTATLADLWRSGDSPSFTAMRARGGGFSATQFVDQLGVLGPDCHVAHGVYMTADDRRRLRARATAVALCPRSNRVIGLDSPPVAAYLTEGNLIAVGTDSLSSSPSLDVLEDVRTLFDLARNQGYRSSDLGRRLLQAATLGGATAMGLSTGPDRVGQLQAGAIADMTVIDVPVSDIVGTIDDVARHGAGRQVETVISGEVRWSSSSGDASSVAPETHPTCDD